MDVQQAYNMWANQYDSNRNLTRDLEASALRQTLASIPFDHCLEVGCGTGKNTEWLTTKAKQITAIDFSEEMLTRARAKIPAGFVHFIQADIQGEWYFCDSKYDLVTFSLILEHIEHPDDILIKASRVVAPKGFVYIGELHPYKQYSGTKARFETAGGVQVLPCFNHNISDFTRAAITNGLEIIDINEFFDDGDISNIPRILTLLLQKK